MSNIFLLENDDNFVEKINIDELYEKKRHYDMGKLELFNKILNRIHVRIKTTSRQKLNEQFCWFIVPEIIIGVPKYDQSNCIAYLMDKLKDNGFDIKYIHPNTLLISWKDWIPSYVRNEIKSKTGIVIDERGNKNEEKPSENDELPFQLDKGLHVNNTKDGVYNKTATKKNYTPINVYKPSGHLSYIQEI